MNVSRLEHGAGRGKPTGGRQRVCGSGRALLTLLWRRRLSKTLRGYTRRANRIWWTAICTVSMNRSTAEAAKVADSRLAASAGSIVWTGREGGSRTDCLCQADLRQMQCTEIPRVLSLFIQLKDEHPATLAGNLVQPGGADDFLPGCRSVARLLFVEAKC